MRYIDIGVNLFCRQFPDPLKILQDAREADTLCILTGSDAEENRMIADFVTSHPRVYGTAGIHPHNADKLCQSDLDFILNAQSVENMVAVGECGLDYDRMFSTKDHQKECLLAHMEIARKTHKPMFLHERSASQDMISLFRDDPDLCKNSVIHCFTGDKKTLMAYLEMGFYIGITGWICDDRRAGDLREAVSVLPLDRVMLETDAPYLTPRNVKGLDRVNVPQNIRYVANELAKYMHINEEELISHARENTEHFFRIQCDKD